MPINNNNNKKWLNHLIKTIGNVNNKFITSSYANMFESAKGDSYVGHQASAVMIFAVI